MDKRGHVYAESRARLQAAAPEMTDDVIARATLLPLAVQLAKRARRVARQTLEGVSQLIPEHTPEPQDAKKPTPAPQKRQESQQSVPLTSQKGKPYSTQNSPEPRLQSSQMEDISQLSANLVKQTIESTSHLIQTTARTLVSLAQPKDKQNPTPSQGERREADAPQPKQNKNPKQKKNLKKKDAQAPPRDAQAEQLARIGEHGNAPADGAGRV